MTQFSASTLSELDGKDVPEWVHLIPSGEIEARDGRRYLLEDAQPVLDTFAAKNIDLPIDYQHQSERPPVGHTGPVPAAGWITKLAERSDGIWGKVQWTETASELIRNREYRFLDPTLGKSPRPKLATCAVHGGRCCRAPSRGS